MRNAAPGASPSGVRDRVLLLLSACGSSPEDSEGGGSTSSANPGDEESAGTEDADLADVENPAGYHRLIGGGVELGETHHDAIVREVDEELGATIRDLSFLAAVESIFRIEGTLGHEIVFLYLGQLDPSPALTDASLTEIDGSVVPVVWRPINDELEPLPLYPSATVDWVRSLSSSRNPQ